MKFEFSAGGIVFKKTGDKILVLLCQHSGHHGWVFPKGHIDPSAGSGQAPETKEEAALREVKEETGVIGEIIRPLEPIQYWFLQYLPAGRQGKEKIKKTVYYFLMEYVSGDIAVHDDEMENVEWLPIDAVAEKLTYPSDKKIWEKTKQQMANG